MSVYSLGPCPIKRKGAAGRNIVKTVLISILLSLLLLITDKYLLILSKNARKWFQGAQLIWNYWGRGDELVKDQKGWNYNEAIGMINLSLLYEYVIINLRIKPIIVKYTIFI